MGLFSSKEKKLKKQKEQKFLEFQDDSPAVQPQMKASWLASRANHYAGQQDFDVAENDLKEALEIQPEKLDARASLSMVLRVTNRTEEALKLLEKTPAKALKAKEQKLGLPIFYKEYGIVCYTLGNEKEAVKHLEKALKTIKTKSYVKDAQFAAEVTGDSLEYLENEIGEINQILLEIKGVPDNPDAALDKELKTYVDGLCKANEDTYKLLKKQEPKASQKELLEATLMSRMHWTLLDGKLVYENGGSFKVKGTDKLSDLVENIAKLELPFYLSEMLPDEQKPVIEKALKEVKKRFKK